MKNTTEAFLALGTGALLTGSFCYLQNNWLQISRYQHISSRLPEKFDGFRVVHLSDLHNKSFGANNASLLKKIAACVPDMIVASGDMIDSRHTDTDCTADFFCKAKTIAPVYYAPGNHEAKIKAFASFSSLLRETGIHVLENEIVPYEKKGQRIYIAGIIDPHCYESEDAFNTAVFRLCHSVGEGYLLLIAHHPEKIGLYNLAGADFVFSGHAHGGQFRLPFTNIGLFAPDQNFFPQYTNGIHTEGKTSMAVSRGLGGTVIPLRLFNRPEIVVVDFVHRQA